jgi:hypothetical protein
MLNANQTVADKIALCHDIRYRMDGDAEEEVER